MSRAYTIKKFEFWRPRLRGTPIAVSPNFVKFYLIFILSILKISSVLRKWLNFEFWRPCLKRTPSFWYPQFSSNFIFSSYLHILKISCVQHEWLKIWNFGGPVGGVPPILICPNFVKFYLFFMFLNPKNFMCLACVVRKFDFWRPHLRRTPILVLQIVLNFMFLINLLTLKTLYFQL